MVQCPRCGTICQAGLPRCPHCGVPFTNGWVGPQSVSPNSSQPLNQVGNPRPDYLAWYLGAGAALVLALLLLGIGFSGGKRHDISPSSSPPAVGNVMSAFRATAPPPVTGENADNQSSQSGMFRVERQAAKPPVISIENESDTSLRLQIEDAQGQIQTEWITPQSTRDITVVAGDYSAEVDSPDNPSIVPSQGEVKVMDFHKYQADFVVGPREGSTDFYIGD